MGKKPADFLFAHLRRMTPVVEKDVLFDPAHVGFFSPDAIMSDAHDLADLVEQLGLVHNVELVYSPTLKM
jgi:hypothetical protein